ncbi:MAG: CerR family C-terminal domain-containing protein, partial [Planctomycetota bacterium]
VETWRNEFRRSIRAHPPDGGVAPNAPVEKRLHGRVLSILKRMLDPESRDFDILQKEMANPTGLLAEVKRESIEPLRRELAAMVRELLGKGASEPQVRLCLSSILSQCFSPMTHERRRRLNPKGLPGPGPPPLNVEIEVLADHITRFSIAGIRDLRRKGSHSRKGGKRSR